MSKQKKSNFLLLLLLISASFATSAQTRYELTVQQAVELAYKNVIELKNAQLDYKIQEAQNKEITGRALPQISANGGTQYFLKVPQVLFPQSDEAVYNVLRNQGLIGSGVKAPPPVLVPFSFQQPWNLSLGATLQQLLFQPDVFVGLQARKTALNLSASVIDQTKEAIKDSAYRRYYAILIAEKQRGFLNESVARLEKLYHDDSVMFKNGFAEQLDMDRVQVQLTNLRTSQSIFNNSILLGYAAMKFALGISQKDTVVLREELTNETVKENVLDENFKYEDRAEIRTLGFNRQLQELDVKRNKLAALPTVALAGNYTVNAMGPKFFTDPATSWLKSSYVGLNVAVPLFDGNQRRYRVKQSQFNVEKVDNNIDQVKQVIDLQQTVSKQSLTNALLNLDAQQRNMTLAESVYNTTKKKFEAGIGSSFEILQAENDLQTAQSNYFNGLYNAIIAKIAYQSSLGKLK
jgi:outer membrane protein TolC